MPAQHSLGWTTTITPPQRGPPRRSEEQLEPLDQVELPALAAAPQNITW
jgi:hypothetical protein